MIRFITNKSTYLDRTADGKQLVRAELVCDTCAELAGVTELEGAALSFGTLALAVRDGEVCALDSEGIWHKQSDGSEVAADG